MHTTNIIGFLLAVALVISLYILLLIRSYRQSQKYKVIKTAYATLHQDTTEPAREFSAFGMFCFKVIKMLGIDLETTRRQRYAELGRAGLLKDNALSIFLFFRWVIQPLFLIVAFTSILIIMLNKPTDGLSMALLSKFLIIGVFGYLGIRLENMVFNYLRKKRDRALYIGFSDVVDLLMVCVEAGQSLDAAIARITRELVHSNKTVAEELERTRLELSLTADRTQALHNLATRTDSMAFRTLVAALVQSEKYGTNLGDTLKVLSDDFRISRLLAAENKAASVGVKITLPLILGMFVPFLMMIIAPAVINAMNAAM